MEKLGEYEKSTKLCIPKQNFQNLIKQTTQDLHTSIKFTAGALSILQVFPYKTYIFLIYKQINHTYFFLYLTLGCF